MLVTCVRNLLVSESAAGFSSAVFRAAANLANNLEGSKVAIQFSALNICITVKEVDAEHGAHFDPMTSTIYWADSPFIPEISKLAAIPQGDNVYPSWVVLAHEIGHVIQFALSGLEAASWFAKYCNFQEFVEMDNIRRHETPIVRSLLLQPRVAYTTAGEKNVRAVKQARRALRAAGRT